MTYMDEAARRMDRRQADTPTVRVREGGSFRGPVVVEVADPNRPSLNELATLATNQRGTVRASARAGSKAHLAELTNAQRKALKAACGPVFDQASGFRIQGSGWSVTTWRALAAKGFGETVTVAQAGWTRGARHQVIGFRINDRGRRAVGQ